MVPFYLPFPALLLRRSAASNLNVKSAFLHMVADALVSLGVIVSGFVIGVTGWMALDPAMGVGGFRYAFLASALFSGLGLGIAVLIRGEQTPMAAEGAAPDLGPAWAG